MRVYLLRLAIKHMIFWWSVLDKKFIYIAKFLTLLKTQIQYVWGFFPTLIWTGNFLTLKDRKIWIELRDHFELSSHEIDVCVSMCSSSDASELQFDVSTC